MSRVRLRGLCLGAVVATWLASGIAVCADEPVIRVAPAPSSSERRILEELGKETALEFIETPLADVVEYLKDLHGIEIWLDGVALDGVGIGSDTPITLELKGVSLRSALHLMLRDLELTYTIGDEVLSITTLENVKTETEVRVYDVSPLLAPEATAKDLAESLADVMLLKRKSAPPSSGGSSTDSLDRVRETAEKTEEGKSARTLAAYQRMLIVRDTPLGHHEFLKTLEAIRSTQLLEAEAKTAAASAGDRE